MTTKDISSPHGAPVAEIQETAGDLRERGSDATKTVSDKALNLTVLKATTILRIIGNADNGKTLTEIVDETGFPTTVCHRMLATLESESLVDRHKETGRYRLGFGLVSLAHKALRKHPIGLHTEHLLIEVARMADDVALLMVPYGTEALCVDRKDNNSQIISMGTQIGSRQPLHCGGGPFAILAFSSDAFISDYLSRDIQKRTSKTVTDPEQIRARIQEARKRGYTIGDEDLFDHVVAVGVPLYDKDKLLIGSVSLSGVKPRYNAKKIREAADCLLGLASKVSSV
jgi:DNA-binding IclR family transcriptional regulator